MVTIDPLSLLISRLDSAGYDPKPTGPDSFKSRCPGHNGRQPNLSITRADDGRVLINCHHEPGCSPDAILGQLGLSVADLFPPDPAYKGNGTAYKGPKRKKGGTVHPSLRKALDAVLWGLRQDDKTWRCVASWEYPTADGRAGFAVGRYDNAAGDKEYRPLHPVPGGWAVGDPPGPLPLYHSPDLPGAETVWFLEGEKCADLARSLGLTATTTAHGAKSPHKSDFSLLAGKTVHIIPDHDQEGESYAAAAVQLLAALTPPPRIKFVRLPLTEKGDDIAEWLESLPSAWGPDEQREALERLANEAPWAPVPTPSGGFVGFVGSSPQEKPQFEGDPRPITTDLLPVPSLPPEMIPASLRGWLQDIAQRGCFPLEYPTAAALVALASLIGRKLAIRPKRHDDWLVVPNLWGALVGPSGIQKTPPVEEVYRPLRRLVADAIKAHEGAISQHNADLMVAKAKAEAAKAQLQKEAKKGASEDRLRELALEASAVAECEAPKLKRHIVNDATIEKLGELLVENPNGLMIFRDELIGLLRTMDRQGHEADRGFYLEGWNGTGGYTWDRIGRGTIVIPNVCLSIFGTIQPGPLARYLRGSASGDEADGFMPRFQILVYPDPPTRFVNVDRYPDTASKNRAYEVFQALDALDPVAKGCPIDEERGIPYLNFAPDAQELFDEWRTDLENRLRSGSEGTLLTCHLAKYRSLLPALAEQFHLIETANRDKLHPISFHATRAAAAWCDLLEAHARRMYQSALDGDPETAERLAERIKQSLPNPFTFRQVAQKGWGGLDTVEAVRQAVGILEDRGWVKVVEVPTTDRGGRPTEEVWIHPRLTGEDHP